MTIEFFLMLLGRAGFVMGIAWLLQISVMAVAFMLSRGATASAGPAIFCGGGALAWITACAFCFEVLLCPSPSDSPMSTYIAVLHILERRRSTNEDSHYNQ